uniref:Alpha/beta hydrolase fold protein n=1 Tax=Cyanothece sp. (strain PCC 7425 / ATCC 29141) TaxID=395961 RepID=B8HNN1_CYAP4
MKTALLRQSNAQERILTLPNGQISYLEWNRGKEPLLLLHGMADHSLVWAKLGEFLQNRYHILAPDLRGHGNSCKPLTGYGCGDIIADLKALMVEHRWSSTHVVAHSWSAKVALVWARQYPEAIRSLVLIDPFFINRIPLWLKPTFPFLYRTLPFLKTIGPFATLEQAERQARQLKQYCGWNEWQQVVFAESMEQKPDGQWGSKFVIQARDEIFADVMETAGLTTQLQLPTLLIQPERGLNRTRWQLNPYHTYLPNLQIVQVPGHHWCFIVEPDACNQTIATFLDSQV